MAGLDLTEAWNESIPLDEGMFWHEIPADQRLGDILETVERREPRVSDPFPEPVVEAMRELHQKGMSPAEIDEAVQTGIKEGRLPQWKMHISDAQSMADLWNESAPIVERGAVTRAALYAGGVAEDMAKSAVQGFIGDNLRFLIGAQQRRNMRMEEERGLSTPSMQERFHMREWIAKQATPPSMEAITAERLRYREQERDTSVNAMQALLEALPEPEEREDTFGKAMVGASRFLGAMGVSAISPIAGTALVFTQMTGMSYDEYKKAGVSTDRAWEAATINALLQTPLEMAGNLLQIGFLKHTFKAFKAKGPGIRRVTEFLDLLWKSAAAEGMEEFLQAYPEEISNLYAAHPEMKVDEIVRDVMGRLGEVARTQGLPAAKLGAIGGAGLMGISGAVQAPFSLAAYQGEKQYEKNVEKFTEQFPEDLKKGIETGAITVEDVNVIEESLPPELKKRVADKLEEVRKTPPPAAPEVTVEEKPAAKPVGEVLGKVLEGAKEVEEEKAPVEEKAITPTEPIVSMEKLKETPALAKYVTIRKDIHEPAVVEEARRIQGEFIPKEKPGEEAPVAPVSEKAWEAPEAQKLEPRAYQETYPEKTVHEDWDMANSPRFVFEGAGDILREFQKSMMDAGYITEKMKRVRTFLQDSLAATIHKDDSLAAARKHEPEKLDRLISQYEAQPAETPAQKAAKELILNTLKGNFKTAIKNLGNIDKNLDKWTGQPRTPKAAPIRSQEPPRSAFVVKSALPVASTKPVPSGEVTLKVPMKGLDLLRKLETKGPIAEILKRHPLDIKITPKEAAQVRDKIWDHTEALREEGRHEEERALVNIATQVEELSGGAAEGVADIEKVILEDIDTPENLEWFAKYVLDTLKYVNINPEILKNLTIEVKPIITLTEARRKISAVSLKEHEKRGKILTDDRQVRGAVLFFSDGKILLELSSNFPDFDAFDATIFHEYYEIAEKLLVPKKDLEILKRHIPNKEDRADAFAEFAKNKSAMPKAPNAFRKIMLKLRRFFQRLKNALDGKGFTRPEDVFGKIAVGAYRPRKYVPTRGAELKVEDEIVDVEYAQRIRLPHKNMEYVDPAKATPKQLLSIYLENMIDNEDYARAPITFAKFFEEAKSRTYDWSYDLGWGKDKAQKIYKVSIKDFLPKPITAPMVGSLKLEPAMSYAEASKMADRDLNIHIRDTKEADNSDRVLLAQIDYHATREDKGIDEPYFDKLYSQREGYKRPGDFWEIPQWIAEAAYTFPKSDLFVVRNASETAAQLEDAGYKAVLFSAMDVNKDIIKEIAQAYSGQVIIGGYVNKSYFAGLKNVVFMDSLQDAAKHLGVPYKAGADYRHFTKTETIPRLCLSTGCLHKCAFCTVSKEVKPESKDVIDKHVESFKGLDFDLVYLNDKTFGQASNYKYVVELADRIREFNPRFQGFIVQTTAPQLLKMSDEFLQKSNIKYVEIGVETYNDNILQRLHKPHNTKLVDQAIEKLRRNRINFIPNILVGLAGKTKDGKLWTETEETYQNTLDFLERNRGVISHVNVYNLALYEGTELAEQIEAKEDIDINENAVRKSYLKNAQVHEDFYAKVLKFGSETLDAAPFEDLGVPVRAALMLAEASKVKYRDLMTDWNQYLEDMIANTDRILTNYRRAKTKNPKKYSSLARYLRFSGFGQIKGKDIDPAVLVEFERHAKDVEKNPFPSAERTVERALEFFTKKDWYLEAGEFLDEFTKRMNPTDRENFFRLVAGLSLQTDPRSNMTKALNAWKIFKEGGGRMTLRKALGQAGVGERTARWIFSDALGTIRVIQSMTFDRVREGALKINDFYETLTKAANNLEAFRKQQNAVIDRWMKIYFYPQLAKVAKSKVTGKYSELGALVPPQLQPHQLARIQDAMMESVAVAKQKGIDITIPELQAMLWFWAKSKYGVRMVEGSNFPDWAKSIAAVYFKKDFTNITDAEARGIVRSLLSLDSNDELREIKLAVFDHYMTKANFSRAILAGDVIDGQYVILRPAEMGTGKPGAEQRRSADMAEEGLTALHFYSAVEEGAPVIPEVDRFNPENSIPISVLVRSSVILDLRSEEGLRVWRELHEQYEGNVTRIEKGIAERGYLGYTTARGVRGGETAFTRILSGAGADIKLVGAILRRFSIGLSPIVDQEMIELARANGERKKAARLNKALMLQKSGKTDEVHSMFQEDIVAKLRDWPGVRVVHLSPGEGRWESISEISPKLVLEGDPPAVYGLVADVAKDWYQSFVTVSEVLPKEKATSKTRPEDVHEFQQPSLVVVFDEALEDEQRVFLTKELEAAGISGSQFHLNEDNTAMVIHHVPPPLSATAEKKGQYTLFGDSDVITDSKEFYDATGRFLDRLAYETWNGADLPSSTAYHAWFKQTLMANDWRDTQPKGEGYDTIIEEGRTALARVAPTVGEKVVTERPAGRGPRFPEREGVGFPAEEKVRIEKPGPVEAELEIVAPTRHTFVKEETEARVTAAQTYTGPTLWQKVKDMSQTLKNRATREYEQLPKTEYFAQFRFDLLKLAKQKGVISPETVSAIKEITADLDDVEHHNFTRAVLILDAVEDIALADKEKRPVRLPYGLTRADVAREKRTIDDIIAASPKVTEALRKRKAKWNEIRRDYIAAMKRIGYNVETRFQRKNYFRHVIMDYVDTSGIYGTGTTLKGPVGRSYIKGRYGSEKDIWANYVLVEHEIMAQMLYDIQIADTLHAVDRNYNMIDQYKQAANEANFQSAIGVLEAYAATMEVEEGKERPSGLDLYRQLGTKMAIGFDNLGRLAAEGSLPLGPDNRWENLIGALAENWSENKTIKAEAGKDWTADMRVPLPAPYANQVLTYANWLLKEAPKEATGRGAAATIFKGIAERRQAVKDILGDRYVTWRELVSKDDNVDIFQPIPGNMFYNVHTVPEQVAEELLEGAFKSIELTADQIRQVRALGGKRRELVLPKEIVATLRDMVPQKSAAWAWHKSMLTKWKIWQLVMPRRYFKYNFRNVSGDADAVFAGNPLAFRKVGQAVRELIAAARQKEVSPDLQDWIDRGGQGTLLQAQEIGEWNELLQFGDTVATKEGKMLKGLPVKLWRTYWKAARMSTDIREAVLRYANYLEYLDQMQRNEDGLPDNYGASLPAEIRGLQDIKDRAFWLANDLLGAYDRISVVGQTIREHMFPFWSWKEVNFVRYKRLLMNAIHEKRAMEVLGRRVAGAAVIRSPFIAWKLGKFVARATALWSMLIIWNYTFGWGDEERDLPEDVRNRPHLLLPNLVELAKGNWTARDSNGEAMFFSRLGALADLLEWAALDTAPQTIQEILNGKTTIKEYVTEMAKAPLNIVVQGGEPFLKVGTELLSRRALFPDVFKPRTIRDRWRHTARSFGLENEYDAMMEAFGKPMPGRHYYKSFGKAFYYSADPFEAAYYDIFETKRNFMKKIGKFGEGFWLTPKGSALYNCRAALRYGDDEAMFYYMNQYFKLGGTKKGLEQSLNNLNPLAGMNATDKKMFLASLDAEEVDKLLKAMVYYVQLRTGINAREVWEAAKPVSKQTMEKPPGLTTIGEAARIKSLTKKQAKGGK